MSAARRIARDIATGLRAGLNHPDAWIVALLAIAFTVAAATR